MYNKFIFLAIMIPFGVSKWNNILNQPWGIIPDIAQTLGNSWEMQYNLGGNKFRGCSFSG
jgi:hypothetical protein